ncbi:MAG: TM2 domain-containing protein [Acidimicrobiia bacterium]|nr:TM2 domain-containing protein [Acidimicrobiia bacterium]MYG59392.1 TM2 domain-containing protein [Acidimicrobiia bacterium]MYJ32686.1 TM2 domain-containing protein [Acidimicrobiia bacterium]
MVKPRAYYHDTAVLLAVLVGGLGADRFYLRYFASGTIKCLCFLGSFYLAVQDISGVLWFAAFCVWWCSDSWRVYGGKLAPADGSGYSDAYGRD